MERLWCAVALSRKAPATFDSGDPQTGTTHDWQARGVQYATDTQQCHTVEKGNRVLKKDNQGFSKKGYSYPSKGNFLFGRFVSSWSKMKPATHARTQSFLSQLVVPLRRLSNVSTGPMHRFPTIKDDGQNDNPTQIPFHILSLHPHRLRAYA
jgi:hypothetical protein